MFVLLFVIYLLGDFFFDLSHITLQFSVITKSVLFTAVMGNKLNIRDEMKKGSKFRKQSEKYFCGDPSPWYRCSWWLRTPCKRDRSEWLWPSHSSSASIEEPRSWSLWEKKDSLH